MSSSARKRRIVARATLGTPCRTAQAHFWRSAKSNSATSNSVAPKLLAEFIGTFAFVFIGAGAGAVIGDGVGLPGIAAIAFAHV
jgi:hypothetical protein